MIDEVTGQRISRLTELVKEKYHTTDLGNDLSHDFSHILRVINSCKKLGEEVNADLNILIPAALLHDIINVPKNHPDRTRASQMAATEAKGILRHVGYDDSEIERIAVVITEHSYSLGRDPSCIESAVLQDADRLDAIGAIGLMRVVTCGSSFGASYYNIDEPFAENRTLDDKKYTIDHLYVKLFKLEEKMNTDAAKTEAKRRAEFLRSFVDQLKQEILST